MAGSSLSRILAQLQLCSLQQQAACTSVQMPLPVNPWSVALCSENVARRANRVATLTGTEPFKHAFELLCNCFAVHSTDIVCALMPQVTNSEELLKARPKAQAALEAFLMYASQTGVSRALAKAMQV